VSNQLALFSEPAGAPGLDQARDLVARYGSALAIVVNMSGGKDSVRMLGYLREQFPNVRMYVVYADTGFEHVRPVSAETWSRERAAAYGLPLHVVRNPNTTFLSMVERRGMFPDSKNRQCTSDLKRGPVEVFIRSLPEKVVLNCIGIRAAESPKRAQKEPWKLNARLSKAGRRVVDWMPIFRESLADVLAWHKSTGTPFHPVYVYAGAGGYLKRFSCRVCIFSTAADLHAIHANDREAFDLVAELEQRIGFTLKSGKSLFQILGQAPASADQYGSEESPCF